MDVTFAEAIEWIGKGADAAGVAVIVVGIVFATLLYATRFRQKPPET